MIGPGEPEGAVPAAQGREGEGRDDDAGGVRRSRVPLLAVTAYVAAASIRAELGVGLRPWALGALSLILAWNAGGQANGLRAASLGALAVTCAALGASPLSPGTSWTDVFAALAALVSTAAACIAIARITAPPSLLSSQPRALSARVPVALVALAWSFAALTSAAQALGFTPEFADNAGEATFTASTTTFMVLMGTLGLTAYRRRLELGVGTRAGAAVALVAVTASAAFAAWAFDIASANRAARTAVVLAATVTTAVVLQKDAVSIARGARRAFVISMAGGSVAVFAAMLAAGRPFHASFTAVLASIAATIIGSYASVFEAPLRPLQGAWLDAIADASEKLTRQDPEDGLRAALFALRAPAGPAAASAELWTFDPPRVLLVDGAGYGREREAALPAGLLAIVADEPEATLRREVLEALAVRRPDLRLVSKWMEDRGALTATVITREREAEGLLVLPHGSRNEPLALEEVRAIKRLADSLASVCSARAMLARSMERERVERARRESLEGDAARMAHEHDLEIGRHLHLAERLARSASIGLYSAPVRMAEGAIERRTKAQAPIALITPSGVDPIPYLARAHIEGPRSRGPFVVVDGTSTREHDLALWTHEATSPLSLADRGTLVLLDAAALPRDVQRAIARALAEKRAPGGRAEPLDVLLAVTNADSPDALLEAGRLDPLLATRLGDAQHEAIALPRLRERAEDLRAIVADRIAREGLRAKGVPVGIDAAAFGRLVDYEFPGEGAELDAIVQRLVASCDGDLVRRKDVDALGLVLPDDA